MKIFLVSLLLSISCFGQVYFTATKQTTLSGAAEAVTVQQIQSPTKTLGFISGYFDCSVACTVVVERNGTPATTTTLTTKQLNPHIGIVSTAVAFSSSNVGTGTVVYNYNCTGACAYSFGLDKILIPNGNGNITIRTSSITGTVTINLIWGEL